MDENQQALSPTQQELETEITALRNQTHRLQTELQQAKEEAGLLIQHAPSAIYEIDLQRLRFTRVNDAMCQRSGYSREELLSINPFDLLDETGKDLLQERLRKTFAAEPIDPTAEYTVHTKEGSVVHVELNSAIHYQGGIPASVYVIAHDVTERKKAEEALRQSEALYRAIACSIPEGGVVVVDRELVGLVSEGALFAEMGMTHEKVEHRRVSDIKDAQLRATLEKHFRQALTGKTLSYELVRGGRTIWVQFAPLFDEQGETFAAIALCIDITKRKKMEQALEQANQHLEQKIQERTAELELSAAVLQDAADELERALLAEKQMHQQLIQSEKYEALARLVASVAHEINNPLQTVKNSLYLLKNTITNPNDQEFMEMALSESSRMGSLVQQLRETYRPAKSLQAVDFNLGELISDVATLLHAQFRQNHVAFEFIHDGQPTIVHGILDQIKQVFLNLFLNAVDALGERGGQIRVALSRAQDPGKVCVAVHDTGPGIPPDHLNKLFEPFFTTKEKGTGLGLAISYEIIKNHGGEITVESRLGVGTTFTVWLPAQDENIS